MASSRQKPDQAQSLDTFIKLLRATESVAADVHRPIIHAGLTVSQFGILEALYHLGPMPQKSVARKILKSAGNITMVIDNLEKQGLVVRVRNQDDRRSFIIDLTAAGQKRIARLFPDHAARIRRRMSCLSVAEQRDLGRLLKKLGIHKKNNDSGV